MQAKKTETGVYQSPLSRLFKRQQPKVRAKKRMAALLLAYAEQDHRRIALLIQTWLNAEKK